MNRFGPSSVSFRCLLLCGWSAFWLEGALVGRAEVAQDRFLKEAPKKWLEYRQIIARHTEGTYSWKDDENLPAKKSGDGRRLAFILNLDQGCARIVADGNIDNKRHAEAFNTKYRFSLNQGNAKQWAIEIVVNGPSRIPDDLMGRHHSLPVPQGESGTFGEAMSLACIGQLLLGGWLPLMVSSPDFKLIRATYVGDEEQLVKVEFRFEPRERTGGGTPSRSGMVVLDATRYWLIREAETEANFFYGVDVRGSLKIANQFSEFTDGKLSVPYVSHQVMHTSSPKAGNVEPRENCRIVDVEMRAAPGLDAKQFTLSAFDLPEPGEVRGAKPWLFWITLMVLLLCISLSVYRRWRKVDGVS